MKVRRRTIGGALKRKATNSGKQLTHTLLWGSKPPKEKRKA